MIVKPRANGEEERHEARRRWLRASRYSLLRLAIVALAALLMHVAAERDRTRAALSRLPLEQVRHVFPNAERLGGQGKRSEAEVFNAAGELLGYVFTTSPEADDLVGYSGPSNLIVGLSPQGDVRAVSLLTSRDTQAHVADVQAKTSFWRQFEGWSADNVSSAKVEAVSGSTLTSLAMAEAIERHLGRSVSLRFPEPLTLEEVQTHFTGASKLVPDQPKPGWLQIQDDAGHTLGYALRTSPQSDNVLGYRGPTQAWMAIDPDRQTVSAVRLRKSYDTPEYVDRVREDLDYLASLAGRSIDEGAKLDFKAAGIEGVSGATQTSYAVAEGVRRRLMSENTPAPKSNAAWQPQWRDAALLAVVIGALLMCFSRVRALRSARTVWQIVLIAGLGIWLGDLLSLALFAGWSGNGVPWRTAPVLVLLATIALVVPWTTRRQVYCHYLCPHGAAQEWLGRFRKLHRPLPEKWSKWLGKLPYLLLAAGFVLSLNVTGFDLSWLEPFDAWVLSRRAMIPAAIAVAGLAASLFVPMAYCRFGCPSGALFKIIQSHGQHDRLRPHDKFAVVLLAAAAGFLWLPELVRRLSASASRTPVRLTEPPTLTGRAFGTTWSVKLRDDISNADALQTAIADELERIESTLSHWRKTSQTFQFNSSRTTVALEFEPEFVALVERGLQLSRATDGAFDMTVAPLVEAWGFGPGGPKENEPTDEEIAAVLQRCGWQKLEIDVAANSIRKRHPDLQLDLGALLQGYAADQIAKLLEERSLKQALIEVGGELRAVGVWTVAIENPASASEPLRTLSLADAALATSGTYRKRAGKKASHIIDPRTGKPVETKWQLCAVIRPSCLEADGRATALLASGDDALEIADRERLAVLVADSNGEAQVSEAGKSAFGSSR
jgi:thiamine biosynthesis lipoprotein ApbE/Na+-translocating ferredoxin:NAD+ oxidoreductase RnfG subunit